MSAHTLGILLLGGGGLAVVIWLLHKLGRALASIAEVLAAAAVVFVALWWVIKAFWTLARGIVGHPRTTGTVLAVGAWCYWLGWLSLAITAGIVAVGLAVWWRVDVVSFDAWAGRWLRSWWLRWTLYSPKLPRWLHACGLSTRDDAVPVDVTVNLVGRRHLKRHRQPSRVTVPKVKKVRSGGSWDEVRIELVPGVKPEDVDESARALASARKVNRCQVREVAPNVVSLDFQRRELLADPVSCPALPELADADGASVDLRRVFAGYTEYGQPWSVPLAGPGAHLLTAGATGAGKNSITWCPLIAAAPAIRDGLVRVSGIDPKGMELAYGRGVFSRYAVTGTDALTLLDELVEAMYERK